MNIHVSSEDDDFVEVGARIKAGGKSPIDRLNTSLMQIVRDTYTMARAAVVNEFSFKEGPIAIAMKDLSYLPGNMREQYNSDAGSLTGAKIRDMVKVRPGDGKKPITLSFYIYINAEAPIIDAVMKAGAPAKIDLIDLVRRQVNDELPLAEAANDLLGDDATNSKKYLFYKDVVVAKINKKAMGPDIEYRLDLEIDSDIYSKVIDSDKFSPYLVYLWVNNALSEAANRAPTIYDPRKSASLTNSFIKKYGSPTNPRPRVNKNGFAIYRDGRPIMIPTAADFTDRLMQAGDAAIDEDGEFDREKMVTAGMANQIIYVDWLNDVMVYTTAHAVIRVLDLQGTMALDPATEALLLRMPIAGNAARDFVPFFRAVTDSVSDLGIGDIQKYAPKGIELLDMSAASVYARLLSMSGTRGKNSDILMSHMCGHNMEEFTEDDAEAHIIPRLIATFRAYAMALNEGRTKKTMELVLPPALSGLGIAFRLIGFEYFMWALTNLDQNSIDAVNKEYLVEKNKGRTEHIGTFDIPNINTGPGGLTGLLPHQATIASSLMKVPKYLMAPVSTGGGKTVISIIRSLFGLQLDGTIRPLITTKGSLVKGTITELNKICGGKINAIPLRPVTLKRMKRLAGIKTFEDLMRWVNKLPPNTIFVNAYTDFSSRSKIYQELPGIPGMLNVAFADSQYQRIIRLLGIRMMDGDESHMIKNPDSARSKGTCAAFGAAEYRGIMSGTMVSNTVLDLVGQAKAISPLIFGGSADKFAEQYGVSTGLIKDDETARIIRERMTSMCAVHQATRDQWSYMLPDKEDEPIYANMTIKQETFYNKLMEEAMLELKLAEENKKKKPSKDTAGSEGDDDEEDDEEDEDEDDEDAEENAFIAKAKTSLQAVEQFLAAPDENEQYLLLADPPTGIDLISPKVAAADRRIDAHLAKNKGKMAENKVIIFGINLSAVKHFARHSKHASKMLVYNAGDLEVLRQFKDDPTKEIMVAAETSVREGENWQMSSLIIKLQPPWAPGDYEQSLARMFRPDPRGRYNRASVEHVVVLVRRTNQEPTLDGVKMARLVSKFISNARVTWEGTPEWKNVSSNFDDLDMLRMNLELIMETKNEDLDSYFTSWKTFVNWENTTNRQSRYRKAQQLEASTGEDLIDAQTGKIKDINKFIQLAMSKVVSTKNIPGTKRVFVPWVSGSIPPDPDNLGYSTIGSQAVSVGQVVYTEFGPGIIKGYSDRNLKIELFGGRVVGIRRLNACTVAPANYGKFAAIVKDPTKWRAASFSALDDLAPINPKALTGLIKTKPEPEDVDDEDDDLEDQAQEDERDEIDVQTAMVNTMPALVIMEDAPELKGLDWKKVDSYLSVRFNTWGGALALIEELDKKTSIKKSVYSALEDEIEELKAGKAMRLTKRIDPTKIRNFFMDQRKKLGKTTEGRFVCQPYFLAIDEDIRLAFDFDSHDPKVIQWIMRNAMKISGVKKVEKKSGFYMRMFNSVVEARKHLTELVGVINFDQADLTRELKELAEELRELQAPRRRPI